MDNLLFSFNATLPVFLLMLLGMLFKKLGWINESFANQMSQFVFLVPLPVLLFKDLATVHFSEVWNFKFVGFCFGITILSIFLSFLLSLLGKDKSVQGEFIQGTYRSSAALLGIAFIENIYGSSVMGPLMIIGSVPLYNIMAVLVLSLFQSSTHSIDHTLWKNTFKKVITNPIIIGIVVGFAWSLLQLPMPSIFFKTVNHISSLATPMGLIAMGATFNFKKAIGKVKPTFVATFMKLIGFCVLFLPLAIALGFRNDQLIAILIMLGSPTTVSCFVMAKNMGHEGTLSTNIVMLTTLLSGFSITFWVYLLKVCAYI